MTQFLVVDVETLGEKPPAALIELGWTSVRRELDSDGLTAQYLYRFAELEGSMLFGIPEGQAMCPTNRAVHHIDPAELEGLPLFEMRQWWEGLDDVEYVVAHNSSFEEQWLDFGLPWICTYKCAIRAWPDAPSHSNQALKYWLGHEDRPDLYPPHRALPDAKVTAMTLHRLLLEHPVETLLIWTWEPRLITKFTFGKHKGSRLTDVPADYLEWIVGPRCDMDADTKHSCQVELDRRRAERSPFAGAAEIMRGYDERNPPPPEGDGR